LAEVLNTASAETALMLVVPRSTASSQPRGEVGRRLCTLVSDRIFRSRSRRARRVLPVTRTGLRRDQNEPVGCPEGIRQASARCFAEGIIRV